MSRQNLILALAAPALMVATVCDAALVITEASSKPAGDYVVDTLDNAIINFPKITRKSDGWGQTFSLSEATTADKIVLDLNKVKSDAPGMELFVQISQHTDAADATPDSVLSTQTATLPSDLTVGDPVSTYLVLDIDDIALAANTWYGVTVGYTSSTSNSEEIKLSSTNDDIGADYEVGISWDGSALDGSTTYDASTSYRDMAIGIIAVPEPASVALMGLGGLAMLPRRRM